MQWLFRLDRLLQAFFTVVVFWAIAGLAYSGVLEDEAATRRARIVHFLVDEMLVGVFGRIGTAVLFVILGLVAAAVILRRGTAA